ncbi:hypothetical protein [Acinetobacter soli]|uniref:hypothetical protein n=1 Tax=Acinetobacter soli TaxID=487316 RepID=UPI002FF17498
MSQRPENFSGLFIGELHTEDCGIGAAIQGNSNVQIGKQTSIRTGIAVLKFDNLDEMKFLNELKQYFVDPSQEQLAGLIKDLKDKEDLSDQDVKLSIFDRGLNFAKDVSRDLIVKGIVAYFTT